MFDMLFLNVCILDSLKTRALTISEHTEPHLYANVTPTKKIGVVGTGWGEVIWNSLTVQ